MPDLKVGDRAPDFALPDETGKTVALRTLRGKKVVLYFYPKDLTSGCTVEACEFRDSLGSFRKAGAVILGVSRDTVALHARFKEKHRLNFPLLADEAGAAVNAYGVWQQKSLYGRKFMGIVRTTFVIDEEGRIAAIFPRVRAKGHAGEVLGRLTGRRA